MKTTDIKKFFASCVEEGLEVERESGIVAEWFFTGIHKTFGDIDFTTDRLLPDLFLDENGTIKAEWSSDAHNFVVVEFAPFSEMIPFIVYADGHRCYAKADMFFVYRIVKMILAEIERNANEVA